MPRHRKTGLDPVHSVVQMPVEHGEPRPQRHQANQRPHLLDFADQQLDGLLTLLESPITGRAPGSELDLVKRVAARLEQTLGRLRGIAESGPCTQSGIEFASVRDLARCSRDCCSSDISIAR